MSIPDTLVLQIRGLRQKLSKLSQEVEANKLPEVTNANNGALLRVEKGKWVRYGGPGVRVLGRDETSGTPDSDGILNPYWYSIEQAYIAAFVKITQDLITNEPAIGYRCEIQYRYISATTMFPVFKCIKITQNGEEPITSAVTVVAYSG